MRYILAFLILFLAATPARAADLADGDLWAMLRAGGAVAMIRHARAPGTGDPPDFDLTDCATQRKLSDDGRTQARALGEAFRQQGVPVADVLSSRWCRCTETAQIAFGRVTPFPPLDSFFQRPEAKTVQMEALKDHLRSWDGAGTLVLVTHQVNITALTGIFPSEGEVIVLERREGDLKLAGRLSISAGTTRNGNN